MPAVETLQAPHLKGGHPPATKVGGGVRIIQHKNGYEKPKSRAERKEDEELAREEFSKISPPFSFSNSIVKVEQEFKTESLKMIQEKREQQCPTQAIRPLPKNHAIQQPKKC